MKVLRYICCSIWGEIKMCESLNIFNGLKNFFYFVFDVCYVQKQMRMEMQVFLIRK